MQISSDEQAAIRVVLDCGRRFGYGNMMAHLATGWRRKLMKEGLSEDEAQRNVWIQGYPLKMQDDMVERGCWDETGEKYTEVC